MKYTAAFLLMLSFGSCGRAQKIPEYETVSLTILRIERVREEVEGGQWLIVKLTMRDSQGIIYRASSRCITTNQDSGISCRHLATPRIANTYPAKLALGGTLIFFGEISPGAISFEIDSEEVSPRAEAK